METKTIMSSETDYHETIVNMQLPYNVYMYWLDSSLLGGGSINTVPFAHSSSVFSVQYVPFITKSDLRLIATPYDTERFKYQTDGSQIPIKGTPTVYRIAHFEGGIGSNVECLVKTLGTFKCYNPTKNIGGVRNWRNESKLYNYPYSVAYLSDGITQPMEIHYQECRNNDVVIKCRTSLNISNDYSIFLEGYKGDTNGRLEQNIGSQSRELPCTSSQYSSWLAQNKNQMEQQKKSQANSTMANLITSTVVGGAVGGGVPGALLGFATGLVGGISDNVNKKNEIQAMENDMRTLPNALTSRGSDCVFGMGTNERKLRLFRYDQREEYLQRIGDYFALYGYRQNKLMKPNLRSRLNYNYIKTINSNVIGNGVPKKNLDILKSIYNNGVTIWHIDRGNTKILDYSKDTMQV